METTTDDSKHLFQSDHHNGCELAQVLVFCNHVDQNGKFPHKSLLQMFRKGRKMKQEKIT